MVNVWRKTILPVVSMDLPSVVLYWKSFPFHLEKVDLHPS